MNKNFDALLKHAVRLLQKGQLVAFPTETVYGLGADASSEAAVKKIFQAKGRPIDHPVIVHLAKVEQIQEWAIDIPELAWQLAAQFWPGPLTLILKKAPHVSPLLTGGQDTVGLRIPNHPIAQALLTAFGKGIAAPSANIFGHISPTESQHVHKELGDKVQLILDGGRCTVGIESTIIDLSAPQLKIVRLGMITKADIQAVIQKLSFNDDTSTIRAPGNLSSHYAPQTLTLLIEAHQLTTELTKLATQNKTTVVLTHKPCYSKLQDVQFSPMPTDPESYAFELYASLRHADEQNADAILVVAPPTTPDWAAINDRLQKAATK